MENKKAGERGNKKAREGERDRKDITFLGPFQRILAGEGSSTSQPSTSRRTDGREEPVCSALTSHEDAREAGTRLFATFKLTYGPIWV
jgi:hypothetical protein